MNPTILRRLAPSTLVWITWLATVFSGHHFHSIVQWWPASLSMILGSFVAGSTPLGGGVIAFPVGVLVLRFSSSESRDLSVLIQSVGMNCAAYLLVTEKRHLLNATFIGVFFVFGACGVCLAFLGGFRVSDQSINVVYSVLVFEFAIFYAYKNIVLRPATNGEGDDGKEGNRSECNTTGVRLTEMKEPEPGHETTAPRSPTPPWQKYLLWCIMVVCAVVGGFAAAAVGTGSDIAMYIFGILCWNVQKPKEDMLHDNQLTASGIVVMGLISLVVVLMRLLDFSTSEEVPVPPILNNRTNTSSSTPIFTFRVLETWAAMVPIVCLGAPLGSLILTPRRLPWLRRMFYFLAVLQLIMFGVLKIKHNWVVWWVIVVLTCVQSVLIFVHQRIISSR